MKHARPDYQDLLALDERIPEDEPVFMFRAQDMFSSTAIQAYIDIVRTERIKLEGGIAVQEAQYQQARTQNPGEALTTYAAIREQIAQAKLMINNLKAIEREADTHCSLFRAWPTKKVPDL